MGDERAVTSMHKDPYENIYCVVRGYKEIRLQPPSDLPWIPHKNLQSAVYKQTPDGVWHCELLPNISNVDWVAIDPTSPDTETHPEYCLSRQYKVTLGPGDVLYLPSLWFHHLTQSQGCIAVNYWYDMEFDVKFNLFNLLQNLKKLSL